MSYVYSEEHCIRLPADFPFAEDRELLAKARARFSDDTDTWKEFAGGTNLHAWRYRAAHEAWLDYCKSWNRTNGAGTHEDLYVRERALFECFTSAVSCIESIVYAACAAMTSARVIGLPATEDDRRKWTPSGARGWLSSDGRTAPLMSALVDLHASAEWATLVKVRNRLSHRGNLPRINYGALGADPPPPNPIEFEATGSTPRLSGDFTVVDALLMWVAFATRGVIGVTSTLIP